MAKTIVFYFRYDETYKSLNRKKKNVPEYCKELEQQAREMMRSKVVTERWQGEGQLAAVIDYKMRHGIE